MSDFVPHTEEQILAASIVKVQPLNGRIVLVDYDAQWPRLFEREAERIRGALGEGALSIEHAGSTSVAGLAAKPIVDIVLVVADSSDEAAYVPAMAEAGYVLRIREPDWFEHRLFKGPDTNINLHVFSAGSPEIERMLLFRDWLRGNPADRDLYERTKRHLAGQEWQYTQNYADAKTAVVTEIVARAIPSELAVRPVNCRDPACAEASKPWPTLSHPPPTRRSAPPPFSSSAN